MRKIIYAIALAILVAMFTGLLASAGGWAVVTLDQLPTQVVAGEPITIGFMVRQHGRTPWIADAGMIQVRATSRVDGTKMVVGAQPQGEPGHYVAAITFPHSGAWDWAIHSGLFPEWQPMPQLTVLAISAAAPAPALSLPTSLAAQLIGALGAIALLSMWLLRRRRLAVAWLSVALVIAATGLIYLAITPALQASPISTPAQSGKELFVAKGCIVCHGYTKSDVPWTNERMDDAPDLNNLSVDKDFLKRWLKNPSAVKPETQMPKLELSDPEIDALVQFLGAK